MVTAFGAPLLGILLANSKCPTNFSLSGLSAVGAWPQTSDKLMVFEN
jgi:hypothetical protein